MNTVASAVAPSPIRPVMEMEEILLSRQIGQAWRAFILLHPVTAAHHATYALLRGKSLDKTFTSLRRPSKIQAHGGVVDGVRQSAEAAARAGRVSAWAPFAALLEGVPTKNGRYEPQDHALFRRVTP